MHIALIIILILVTFALTFAGVWYWTSLSSPSTSSAAAAATLKHFGISYKTKDETVEMIIGDVQTIWDQAQLAACKQFHDMFAGMKGSVATATAANPNMTCKDIKAQLRDEITKNIGAAAFNSGVDTVALTKNVEKLYTHVIDAVCVNDAVDVKKVDALMDALFAAVCYAA